MTQPAPLYPEIESQLETQFDGPSPPDQTPDRYANASSKDEPTAEDPTHQAQALSDSASEKIPDGGYGWVIVACLFSVNASTWGECDSAYLGLAI